jgi:drug/metabolite transporter (DMT)-like permease
MSTVTVPFASSVIALGLIVAALWGVSDFLGGIATRKAGALLVVAVAHGLSLMILIFVAVATRATIPTGRATVWGLIAGLTGGLAIIAFYSALAGGQMGLTAAMAGLLTAVIPVVFAFFTEGRPKATQLGGFALAAAAIWFLAYEPGGKPRARGLGLATLAGVGFGIFLITSKFASQGALLWPLAASRLASTSLACCMLFATRKKTRGDQDAPSGASDRRKSAALRAGVLIAGVTGLLEAFGNLLYMIATHAGRLDVAAVLSSLYPATTILLAIWILKERLSPRKIVGIGLALAAAVVISL